MVFKSDGKNYHQLETRHFTFWKDSVYNFILSITVKNYIKEPHKYSV